MTDTVNSTAALVELVEEAADSAAPPPPDPLNNMHMVMFLGFFCIILGSLDLNSSLNSVANKQQRKKLKIMIGAAIVLYVFEFFTTLGSVIEVLCPVDLWLLAISHYGIKVIVSYSYVFRVELVLKGKMGFGNRPKLILKALSLGIILTAVTNWIKVLLTYKSKVLEDGSCGFFLPEYWSYLDEIMFGIIDFMTLVFLYSFYKEKTDKGILKGHTQYKVYRVLLLSTVTFGATIMATIINNQIPAIGLTSSIIDITTDILSMMRVYTRPPQTDKKDTMTGATSAATVTPNFLSGVEAPSFVASA